MHAPTPCMYNSIYLFDIYYKSKNKTMDHLPHHDVTRCPIKHLPTEEHASPPQTKRIRLSNTTLSTRSLFFQAKHHQSIKLPLVLQSPHCVEIYHRLDHDDIIHTFRSDALSKSKKHHRSEGVGGRPRESKAPRNTTIYFVLYFDPKS